MVNCSPFGPKPQFELAAGTPAVGNQLFFYVAGSVNTKQSTFTDSTGLVANANPIVLNSLGQPNTEIWFTAGQSYKVVYAPSTDTDPPTSPIWSIDNLDGINDTTVTIDEWVAGPIPTFIGTTSFTLVGDQTSTFHKGRRVKTVNAGGTIYSTIISSVFGALTTVTVANDSGVLDAGLSTVSYSLVSADGTSIDADMVNRKGTAVVSAATTNIWGIAGDYVHVTGNTGPITSLGTAPYAGAQRVVVFDSTPTVTHNATTLILPGEANIVAAAGDRMVVRADTTANMVVIDYIKATGLPPRATQPTRQVLTTGTAATYTTPTNCTRINVRQVGGGGGGFGSAGGGDGTASTWSGGSLSAGGGPKGTVGGTTSTAPATSSNGDINLPGSSGQAGNSAGSAGNYGNGGAGGASAFGGSGSGGAGGVGPTVGLAGGLNTGGGGGSGGTTSAVAAGGGGGSGAYCEKLIIAPAANYTYTVGAGGAGGASDANHATGGNGADGLIVVDEWYD